MNKPSHEPPRDLAPGAPRGAPITIDLEGRTVRAFAGEPVAVALYAEGTRTLGRSAKYHRPRGLFCLEGHCNSCYMRIDGRPNIRSCMTPARPGLRCERQNAFPNVSVDVLRAADWLFPGGMDHHTLMTGTRAGNDVFLKIVRRMGGSGRLPDAPAQSIPDAVNVEVDVCVVGAGPAGLAAARAAGTGLPRASVMVFDEQEIPGGSLLAEMGGVEAGRKLADAATAVGAKLCLSATAIGFYPEDEIQREAPRSSSGRPSGVLAIVTPTGLVRVNARRYVYATGGYDQNLPFVGNDRPGVLSARACGRLAFRFGVRPGKRVVVMADAPYAGRLAAGMRDLRVETEVIDARLEPPVRTRGVGRMRGIEVGGPPSGAVSRIAEADAIAVAVLPAPASELPRQHGAAVRLDIARGGFAVQVDESFATTASYVFACGDVAGYVGPAAAEEAGRAAGVAVARSLAPGSPAEGAA